MPLLQNRQPAGAVQCVQDVQQNCSSLPAQTSLIHSGSCVERRLLVRTLNTDGAQRLPTRLGSAEVAAAPAFTRVVLTFPRCMA